MDRGETLGMTGQFAYSIEQLSELLPISRSRIFEEIKSGALRSFTIGRRRLVSHQAVMEYIQNRETSVSGSTSVESKSLLSEVNEKSNHR